MPQQLEKHQTQNLRLRNPTPYHLMATGQLPPTHPLSDVHSNNNRDSPTSETLDFHEAFIMNSFNQQEYEEDNNSEYPVYGRSESFGSTGPTVSAFPMNIHRKSSSNLTDISHSRQEVIFNHHSSNNHQPIFMPSSSLDSTHSLAMSAPANMGYDLGFHPTSTAGTGNIPSSSSNTSITKSFEDDYAAQMNMQLMMEKRRRRRESHNAVERRRRDNINDRIHELCSLLPENALENISVGPNNKPNKGVILKKSVEHMRQLQQQVQSYHQRIQDLENALKEFYIQQRQEERL
ncbi:hypothetical protein G6F46_001608 [Rhizopus delemar]|uniref:BHLH domain-containing protein n=2 Tax=Rhizopus TaxID=4842 RepID=A0A9P6Z801_9FUNG|nr:hypothetical protein G6F55_000832 [Rhizopus delemar]KAG1541082.1 hypothetical protein G6F51_008122 [Rhizopus arrhizus]KAG1500853.1 hypothetical protein G6F54_003428 [Rhizopus delemar]KAG1506930.1 hypothetical protein G6F53_009329 [Rhizopus delemar]KAG1521960.1 hypothetical protein G6F52_006275 [Rhizopus delemar]